MIKLNDEYIVEYDELKNKLDALTEKAKSESPVQVGDIAVDEQGNEYLIRELRIDWTYGFIKVDKISRKKKNGEWDSRAIDRINVRGYLQLKKQ